MFCYINITKKFLSLASNYIHNLLCINKKNYKFFYFSMGNDYLTYNLYLCYKDM